MKTLHLKHHDIRERTDVLVLVGGVGDVVDGVEMLLASLSSEVKSQSMCLPPPSWGPWHGAQIATR